MSVRLTIQDVIEKELEQIETSRRERKDKRDVAPSGGKEQDQLVRAGRSKLLGLSFSGGGIRSATFNLGVLQALAKIGLMRRVDYLSTVSGGGYIGSWLLAWIRNKKSDLADVLTALGDGHSMKDQDGNSNSRVEPPEIRWLRQYSNYLTPRVGLGGGDTWAVAGTYLRNLILNQLVLIFLATALLLAALVPIGAFRTFPAEDQSLFWWVFGIYMIAITTIVANVSALLESGRAACSKAQSFATGPLLVHILVVLPIFAGSWMLWTLWWKAGAEIKLGYAALFGALFFAGLWAVGWSLGSLLRLLNAALHRQWRTLLKEVLTTARLTGLSWSRKAGSSPLVIVVSAGLSGAVGGLLLFGLRKAISGLSPTGINDQWYASFWGIPIVIVICLLVEVLHIGLVERRFSEEAREWLARLGGLVLLWTICWSLLTLIALDGPWLIDKLLDRFKPESGWIKWGLTSLWAATTGMGILAGKSPKTGGQYSSRTLEIAGKVAPPFFILGLLLLVSAGVHHWLPSLLSTDTDDYWKNAATLSHASAALCVLALAVAAVLSWRIGINEFSMNGFYKNRLVRCYLGASNPEREEQPFTGFDPRDDFDLTDLANTTEVQQSSEPVPSEQNVFLRAWQRIRALFSEPIKKEESRTYYGPYPIVNAALNLVGGKELAWQQRKAASFMMTPWYCGYEFTKPKGGLVSALQETRNGNVSLGFALAVSGAAASPNMGYHSSPFLTFLMTVFNVRLGQWMGNTRNLETWKLERPTFPLRYLLCELLGRTNEERPFVYVSDGGHFENLGIYELVRRRCQYIVACDAGEDHEMKFSDLGNAIEKCRTDLGIDISIDIEPLRRDPESGKSDWHCAVGTIHYDKQNNEIPSGKLLYLKASLSGDETTDVERYAAYNPSFPHHSTADQFFDELQFESYRMLGEHIATNVFEAAAEREEWRTEDLYKLFVLLKERWHPPSKAGADSFTKHTASLVHLFDMLRRDADLRFLHRQIYPEWERFMDGVRAVQEASATLWLPSTERERRAGFYFCNQLIQLMEDVYMDLNFEDEFGHPDNRGWMNLFRHWSWSGMFNAAWSISIGTYGARFQRFCERRLDLRLGRIEVGTEYELESLESRKQDHLLNDWELQVIDFFRANCRSAAGNPVDPGLLKVLPLQIMVGATGSSGGGDQSVDSRKMRFAFGFALAEILSASDGKIVNVHYFRIQDHLRKMGLARKALLRLKETCQTPYAATWFAEDKRMEILGRSNLSPDASLAEALPTKTDALGLQWLFDWRPAAAGGREDQAVEGDERKASKGASEA